ncbi:putative F-box only protein 15 [Raphanus sativus]|nr:putative F-box only protein 15 [Raphanus sativus]
MASSQRSWSLSSLPLDLIEEIFHRTPAESLLRSKPTCKKWRHLIDNKRFIYEHLRRFPEQRRFLRIDETVQVMDPVRRTRSETPIPYELQPLDNIKAMVHCDGVMLCMCSDMGSRFVTLSLWNPLTRHIALIQPSTRFTTSDHYGIGYGIDKYRDGYKILRFSDRRYFEIYYCGTSSWRTLDDAEVDWSVDFRCQGVSVMGNMYWLAHRLSLLLQDKEVPSVIEVWVSSKLPDDVSFTKYFRVVNPGLPWLRIDRSETASHPVYYIAKSKRIVAWCENVVVLEGGRLPVCTILYEIDEGGVVAQHETERHEDNDYIGTFLCGYVYVPSLVPLP